MKGVRKKPGFELKLVKYSMQTLQSLVPGACHPTLCYLLSSIGSTYGLLTGVTPIPQHKAFRSNVHSFILPRTVLPSPPLNQTLSLQVIIHGPLSIPGNF